MESQHEVVASMQSQPHCALGTHHKTLTQASEAVAACSPRRSLPQVQRPAQQQAPPPAAQGWGQGVGAGWSLAWPLLRHRAHNRQVSMAPLAKRAQGSKQAITLPDTCHVTPCHAMLTSGGRSSRQWCSLRRGVRHVGGHSLVLSRSSCHRGQLELDLAAGLQPLPLLWLPLRSVLLIPLLLIAAASKQGSCRPVG